MPLQATSGAASYDAFGGGVPVVPAYIEEVFSTFLYSGTGASQTITNNIDLSTKGGLVWLKARNDTRNNWLYDTVRGKEYGLRSDLNFVENYSTNSITAFNNNGFSIGDSGNINTSGNNLVSWTWAKAPKFFDVVTYTGNGSTKTISHSLGSVPGCIIVKDTSDTLSWVVYHRSNGNDKVMYLNGTQAVSTDTNVWNSYTPTATDFQVGGSSFSNSNGDTYVAYVFAHNAGGFGLTGTDNVISCGSFTYSGSEVPVNLGYEPQFILAKTVNRTIGWEMYDVMRGMPAGTGSNVALLSPNSSGAESVAGYPYHPTATGFIVDAGYYTNPTTVIYIAIRRGPMKVPTSGTSVFSPNTANASAGTAIVTNFPVDLSIAQARSAGDPARWEDRLRGVNSPNLSGATPTLRSDSTAAETTASITLGWDNTQIQVPSYYASVDSILWNFRRAPSFFDEVCYAGDDTAMIINHNLGVPPELIIVKKRNDAQNWTVSRSSDLTKNISLNVATAENSYTTYSSLTSTTVTFNSAGTGLTTSGSTYVMYLFATCAGVSKVFLYTGNGSSQTINCGFTGGARWILIKRTDSTGDWYVWDTARGIVSGNDPYLRLNSTAAEVTTNDTIDTDSTGFVVNQVAATNVNVSSATYIGLAIA
jgi:hypothetical protein